MEAVFFATVVNKTKILASEYSQQRNKMQRALSKLEAKIRNSCQAQENIETMVSAKIQACNQW